MTDEDVLRVIEEVRAGQPGRGFVTHVARAYLPPHRARLARGKGGPYACALTSGALTSVEGLWRLSPESCAAAMEYFRRRADWEADVLARYGASAADLLRADGHAPPDHPERTHGGGPSLAVLSDSSDQALGMRGRRLLWTAMVRGAAAGDRAWTQVLENVAADQAYAGSRAPTTWSGTTLADLGVLQGLKRKMGKPKK